jgi:hypothetical protein
MKTKNELKAIIQKWWEYNQTLAQVGEARYFVEQIGDWESDFENYQSEGYIQPVVDFDVVRCKDVPGGISLRIESDTNVIDGILNIGNGILTLKDLGEVNTTGSMVFQTARIVE